MKIIIFSDVHSNLEAMQAFLSDVKKESPDLFIFAGDVVGYGADPEEVAEIIKEKVSICVAGNHDYAAVQKTPLEYFNSVAREAIEWTMEKISKGTKKFLSSLPYTAKFNEITITHSTFSKPEEWEYIISLEQAWREFHFFDTQIGVVGHSHIPFAVRFKNNKEIQSITVQEFKLEEGWRYMLNPGSIGQPRDGDPRASFIIYDRDKKMVRFKRIKYNVRKAQEKIIQNGLPSFLAERLAYGK